MCAFVGAGLHLAPTLAAKASPMLLPSVRPILLNCAVHAASAAATVGAFFFSTSVETLPRQVAIAFWLFWTYFTPSLRSAFWHLSRLVSAGPFGAAWPTPAARITAAVTNERRVGGLVAERISWVSNG